MRPLPIAWDACGLINLVATERSAEILEALSVPSFLVRQVKDQEVLYLRPDDLAAEQVQWRQVSVDTLVDSGNITLIDPTTAELSSFVTWASVIDDGEAYSLAVAEARGLQVATDDKATINHMGRQTPPIPAVTTPEWLKMWADTVHPHPSVLQEAITHIGRRGRYRPNRSHPLREWWEQFI